MGATKWGQEMGKPPKFFDAAAQGAPFDGRNELLELLAISCWKQNKWGEARNSLLELISVGDVRYDGELRLVHTLAEVYMAEGDLNKAANYGFQAVKGRRSAFGKGNVLFLDSVALLVEIYEAKGDIFEAQGYEGTYLNVPISEARVSPEQPDSSTSPHMRIILHSHAVLRLTSEGRRVARWEERNAIRWLEENNFASAFISGSKSEIGEDVAAKALHKAAEQGHIFVMRVLLKKGANINAKIPRENATWPALETIRPEYTTSTALLSAIEHGQEIAINFLLDNGASIDYKASDGRTALHCAAEHGREVIVQLLLNKGADVGARDTGGLTAFNYATINVHEAVMGLLLDNGAMVEETGQYGITALHSVAVRGKMSAVQMLLRRGASVHTKAKGGRIALHSVAGTDHDMIAGLLIENGADVNAQDGNGWTPLHLVRRESMVRLPLDKGANIHTKGFIRKTALHFPIDPGAVDLLLEKGLPIELKMDDGNTPLHEAAQYLLVNMAWKLLEKGAKVNAKENLGETPLCKAVNSPHEAGSSMREGMVKLLLAYGADPPGPIGSQSPPLAEAKLRNDEKIVALLTMKRSEIISRYFPQGLACPAFSISGSPGALLGAPRATPNPPKAPQVSARRRG
jgi:ankyrin repeat protein